MQTSRTREQIRMLWVLGRLPYFHLSHYYKSLPNLGSPHLAVLSQSSILNLLLWLYIVHQKPPGMSHACRPLLQERLVSRMICHSLIFWRLPSIEDVHVLSRFSHVQLFVTLWTAAYQAPPSMGFSLLSNDSEKKITFYLYNKITFQWTWVWANSRRHWKTGKPGVPCGCKGSDTT